MEGSKFCMWHHRDDYLEPEDLFPKASDPKSAGRICCVRCGEPGGRFKATGLCYRCMYFPNVVITDPHRERVSQAQEGSEP
jgi:hypothetical protein